MTTSENKQAEPVACNLCGGNGLEKICCGRTVTGAEYMGQQEELCCGNPDADSCPGCNGTGYTHPTPAVAQEPVGKCETLRESLFREFPLLEDHGLDEVEHHCEWNIQQERKRLHALLNKAPAVAQSWELNEETAKFLADLILANDEPTPVTLSVGFIKDDDGKIQHGLRVHESEYPEEGGELLVESTPSPQKAPPAEVVRELVEALEYIQYVVSMGLSTDKARERVRDVLNKAKEHGL